MIDWLYFYIFLFILFFLGLVLRFLFTLFICSYIWKYQLRELIFRSINFFFSFTKIIKKNCNLLENLSCCTQIFLIIDSETFLKFLNAYIVSTVWYERLLWWLLILRGKLEHSKHLVCLNEDCSSGRFRQPTQSRVKPLRNFFLLASHL